ncbi:hypothetical protein ACKC9G_07940 [Pokkaliibacter sp. CJK22405]|uniref:hypothetical protein n=1 Tax=Pokkaliibacter sp. CJK22405 TaxID=3384615 RepID=UPI0039849829
MLASPLTSPRHRHQHWLIGLLLFALLQAHHLGFIHGIEHTQWQEVQAHFHGDASSEDHDEALSHAHSCLAFDAASLAITLQSLSFAAPSLYRRALRISETTAPPVPPFITRRFFAPRAPPSFV